MKKRSSAGPKGRITGLFLKVRTWLFLLLPPLVPAALLFLPYAQLEVVCTSTWGVEITDRNGVPLYCLPGPAGSYMIKKSWAEIPAAVKEIFVRLEDKRFYRHAGIDPLAVLRSLVIDLFRFRIVSGASTISMQLSRLVSPHGGGIPGKLKEAVTALRIETHLRKDDILLLYLNHLPFGYHTTGVAAAARLYYDKCLEDLSEAQLLLLACIPKAPALYDPFKQPERLKQKAASLAPMVGIKAAEIDEALSSVKRGNRPFKAPHFVNYIIEEKLAGLEGLELAGIVTTLDYGLYRSVLERIGRLSGRADSRLSNAAVLVIDNRSGEILVWLGSGNYFDDEHAGQIDGVRVRNQSGSTLKPFFYALALEGDYSAASLLPDLPLNFGAGETYRPENFDRRNRGPVRLRTALASSLNVPAVFLLSRLGLDQFLRLCRELGIDLPEISSKLYGLGAAIGNIEVSLYELTCAFSVFPNQGLLFQPRCIKALKTIRGELIPRPGSSPGTARRIYGEETAWLISDILSDPSARVSGFGTESPFNTPFQAMFKSGTASEYSNLWCLGATAGHTMGVWAGNLDGSPASGATGSSLPAVVVVQTLEQLSTRGEPDLKEEDFQRPEGIIPARICTLSGRKASASCPSTRTEYFLAGKMPAKICQVHGGSKRAGDLPAEALLEPGGRRNPRILFPIEGAVFYLDRGIREGEQRIQAWIAAPPGEELSVRLNGRPFNLSPPHTLDLPVKPGSYSLEVRGRSGRDKVSYFVK